MGEPLGQLKVMVVQGKRLVIRDFKSSDPYVIVKLGNQVILGSCMYEQHENLSFSEFNHIHLIALAFLTLLLLEITLLISKLVYSYSVVYYLFTWFIISDDTHSLLSLIMQCIHHMISKLMYVSLINVWEMKLLNW